MSRPNINIPAEFAINGTKTDFSQAKITDGFDRLQPDVLPGDNLNKFIDDTYKGLNGVLELFEGCVLYDAGTTYNNTSLVFAIINNNIKLYHSIQNDNTGNPLTDTDYWEEVNLGGGYEVGDVIWRLTPTQDSGKHLLDGALIDGSGSYAAFVTYIAGLVTDYPDLFVTEADWQSSVSTYGVCGKFVYDSTNNTVRLPKVTGIIEGTIDVTALGDLVNAGLPNITGTVPIGDATWAEGAFYYGGQWSGGANAGGNIDHYALFNASRSSSLYKDNFNKVQPQTIKGYFYIVIATSTKTDIEVDIDEIATDLNGKADVDLSNVSNISGFRKLVEVYNNGASWYKVFSEYNPTDGTYIGLWCEQGGEVSNTTGGATLSVTFLKPFSNTNYELTRNQAQSGPNYSNTYSGYTIGYTTKTTTGFTFIGEATNFASSNIWRACGYIS